MTYRATHITTYTYSEPVSICHNEVHLRPRSGYRQTLIDSSITVLPDPGHLFSRTDYFGNETTFFSIHEPHSRLIISADSMVEVRPATVVDPEATPAWEDVRAEVRAHRGAAALEAFQFVFPSQYVKAGPKFASFAEPSFPAGRPLLKGLMDLSHRIFTQFRYDPRATTVATPVDEVLQARHGVCQDFAHVMIGALRAIGLPARYVSGYLRSNPNLVGAEESHAWVSAYCPGHGWLDIDPTNNLLPSEAHITLAWGRDYGDVTPVRGVALGGGEQLISVRVRVAPEKAAVATD